MNFRSDNVAAAAPQILAAVLAANEGAAAPYGEDQWSRQLNAVFSDLFEHEAFVFPMATGTAANSIALAALAPAGSAIICHREAHIERDEAGAPEFFSGAKLALADGLAAKLGASALEQALARFDKSVHSVQPSAISISQATERGAVYKTSEIAALSAIAKRTALGVHMDGARFGNAVAALGCAPADISWRAGVDALSFGATKNGALGAEAVIVFDAGRAESIARRRKRGGHLLSKGRYLSAQLLAYVKDGLWLKLAQRANDLARPIGEAAGAMLSGRVETNQVFVRCGVDGAKHLRDAGVDFLDWGEPGAGEARFVVSWNQDEREVEALCALLRALHA